MKKSIIDSFSDIAFINIVNSSESYKECLQKLGYNSSSNDVVKILKNRINKLGIDISHFRSKPFKRRTFETVFCMGSTADGSTLRDWYKKGKYSRYICAICGQEPMWQGKPMPLILDHINGYNKDNRLENLRWVCGHCNLQLETTNGRNINHGKRKHYYCIDCGREVSSKSSERCYSCAAKLREKNRKKPQCAVIDDNTILFPNANGIVKRDILKALIRNKPFTYVGEYYGVSDNAVRKWCKKFGLPTKSLEIRKISDEDWEKI